MHAALNKHDKVSLCFSRTLHYLFCQEIRTIKVIRCPRHSSPQEDVNSNPNPHLNDKPSTDANPIIRNLCKGQNS